MRCLLDECLPHQLRGFLRHHETSTAVYAGFGGLKNGDLLDAAERAGFGVLITGDLSLEYQQNFSGRKLAVVSLSAQNWRVIRPNVTKIAAAVDGAKAGEVVRVECGVFSRRRPRPEGPALG